jgi:hypothetical protein
MDQLSYSDEITYTARRVGPHRKAELLCPNCGGLLAIGWLPDQEAVWGIGSTIACAICKTACPTLGARDRNLRRR